LLDALWTQFNIVKKVLFLFAILFSSYIFSHQTTDKMPVDCSSEIISSPTIVNGEMIYKYKRRTHFSIPISLVKSHFQIPVKTGFGGFNLPLVAEGVGEYKFKDSVTVPLKSDNSIISVIDPFGVPWKEVSEHEKDIIIKNVKCYIVN